MRFHRYLATGCLVSLCGLQAYAEDTAGDIAEKLNAQLGQPRGLVIAPSSETNSETSGATQVVEGYVPVGGEVRIDVPIKFDFDSAVIRPDQRDRLETVCEGIKSSNVERLQIIGHTDASGSATYNASLSKLRADEVKRFMVDSCGISATRLEAIGVGEEFPANQSDPRADENRRVEFQALS